MSILGFKKVDGKIISFQKQKALLESGNPGFFNEFDYIDKLVEVAKRVNDLVCNEDEDLEKTYEVAINTVERMIAIVKELGVESTLHKSFNAETELGSIRKIFLLNMKEIKRNNLASIRFSTSMYDVFLTPNTKKLNSFITSLTVKDLLGMDDEELDMNLVSRYTYNIAELMSKYDVKCALDFIKIFSNPSFVIRDRRESERVLNVVNVFSSGDYDGPCCEVGSPNDSPIENISGLYKLLEVLKAQKDAMENDPSSIYEAEKVLSKIENILVILAMNIIMGLGISLNEINYNYTLAKAIDKYISTIREMFNQ